MINKERHELWEGSDLYLIFGRSRTNIIIEDCHDGVRPNAII